MIFDDITYMRTLKTKDANSLLNKTEIDSQIMVAKGGSGGISQGFGIKQTHATLYKIDNQQGPTVVHRKLYSIFCNNL